MARLFRLRQMFMRGKPFSKLVLLGVLTFMCVAYFAYVSLLSVESMDKNGRSRSGKKSGDFQGDRVLKYGNPLDDRVPKYGNPLDVPRVAQYCNLPKEVKLGEEGDAPGDYLLKSVFVLIRHGDRTPMSSYLDVPRPEPEEGCTLLPSALWPFPDLHTFLTNVDPQKDRQPHNSEFAKWALYPQHKRCSSSQLTGNGALQHLLNGLALKEKYVKQWNLFGDKFSPRFQLHIRSTQTSRTYQSAMALLYGFLPRFDVKELDVKLAKNSMFCSANVPQECCANLKTLKQEADKGNHERGGNNPLWVPAMAPLADVFGVEMSQLPWPTSLIDMLQGHACHGLPLPCGPEWKCVTPDMMDTLWKLVVSDQQSYNNDTRFDRYSRTIIHSLLLEILNSLQRAARGKSVVKFTLFSGHDLTVSPLLQALGVHDGMWPHYATRVIFELYETMTEPKKYYVRIVHNGRNITPKVRFCRDVGEDGMCPLENFEDFVTKENMVVMGVYDRASLEALCRFYAP